MYGESVITEGQNNYGKNMHIYYVKKEQLIIIKLCMMFVTVSKGR